MFAQHGVIKLAGTALVASSLGLAALAAAGTAGALSSADDTFLNEITAAGLTYDTKKEVIGLAHEVCVALDDGMDPVDVGLQLMDVTNATTDEAATFVLASVGNYCPEHAALFG